MKFNVKFEDEEKAVLLMATLPQSFDHLITTLTYGKDKLEYEVISEALLSFDKQYKARSVEQPAALLSERRGRKQHKEDRRNDGKPRGRSKSKAKKDGCFHCGKPGHIKKDCWIFKKETQEAGRKNVGESNNAAMTTEEEAMVVLADECLHVNDNVVEWVIDSGASFHITPNRQMFATYRTGDFGKVKMGNSACSNIVGIGDVVIQTETGCQLTLKEVRHVPDIRLNLISVNALDEQGYNSHFGSKKWKLTKGAMIVAKGDLCCSLYKTRAKSCSSSLNAAVGSLSSLWHKRLGHMSEKGLQHLAKKKLIPLQEDSTSEPCDHCVYGKQHRVAFKGSSSRMSGVLERVRTYVCGPMEVESIGGAKFFVTFIDDASRRVWVYLLKSKDEVFKYFKHFHVMVERETGKKLKCLRSDNGGEYTSHEFRDYCFGHGIRHEKTVPGTPQHNGVAECMNRTILERVRCMRKTSRLPKSFWGAVVQTAVYLINRSPSVPLDGDVPERVWRGKDISYSHLRVFGCQAFAHVPKEQRTKLDDKALPCIFIGYGNEEFGYRLWDPKNKKVIRSRDVIFHEEKLMGDHVEEEKEVPGKNTLELLPQKQGDVGPEEIPDDEDAEDEPAPEDNHQGEHTGVPEGDDQPLRQSTRERVPSRRYPPSEFVLLTERGEPEDYCEALAHKDRARWMEAMRDEMNSLKKNQTYELVRLPKGRKALQNKWVFRLKDEGQGSLVKHKARLVVKGFGQKKGIDFDEIFSPVVKMTSIRTILGLAASLDLEMEQMDVRTAFLHGDLEEEIYMQ
ncbi:hypothetical protein CR513_33901, partial [Mucuna pruriens]